MTPIETIKAMCWLLAVLGIILILQDRRNDKLLAENKKLREEVNGLRILVDFMKLTEEQEKRK